MLEPGGQTLLVGYELAGKQIWHLVDIQRGRDQVLTSLELFTPYLRDVDHRQIIFEGFDPATNQRHAMLLELATGNVRALPHLPGQYADRIVELKAISPDGRFFLDSRQETECVAPDVCLITAYELWLRPLNGDPPLLLLRSEQAPHAAFSPDGRWVAVSTLEAGAHLQLIATDGDDVRDLGPGYGAVWLQP